MHMFTATIHSESSALLVPVTSTSLQSTLEPFIAIRVLQAAVTTGWNQCGGDITEKGLWNT